MQFKPSALFVFLLALALSPAVAQKTVTGSAHGNLTVDGRSIPLRYAYSVEVDNVEEAGLMPSGPQKYLVLVLSDGKLPLSSVADRNAPFADRHSPGEMFAPLHKSSAERMYGVLLHLDLQKKMPFQAELFYPGKQSLFSVVGTQVPDQMTNLKREGDWISGTAFLANAQDTGLEKGPKKYQYRVSFRALVRPENLVTAKWEGKDALASPPVRTLHAYLAAARNGDVPALRRLTAQTHQPYLDRPEMLKFLQSADVSKLAEQVRRVVVRGNSAAVVCVNKEPNYSQVTIQLVRDKGAWKLYWP